MVKTKVLRRLCDRRTSLPRHPGTAVAALDIASVHKMPWGRSNAGIGVSARGFFADGHASEIEMSKRKTSCCSDGRASCFGPAQATDPAASGRADQDRQ